MILSVDTGLRACGCALWDDGGQMQRAELVRGSDASEPDAWADMAEKVAWWAQGFPINVLVFEQPGFRRGDGQFNQKGREALVAVGGALCGVYWTAKHVRVHPFEWQGNLRRPKNLKTPDPVIARVRSRLTAQEMQQVALPSPGLEHNVWDAVGIGLHHFGRMSPKKVYPR